MPSTAVPRSPRLSPAPAFSSLFFVFCLSALFTSALLPVFLKGQAFAVASSQGLPVDSDQDGMSDALEQELLLRFLPTFMVGRKDCSNIPAEFKPGLQTPTVAAENGTIYGQVFPAKNATGSQGLAEIHYYHLWNQDCGPHGHPLDTEHVAVLIAAPEAGSASAGWKALYWYAAAHEDTVCDVSQITRASTLDAVDHGATVWISPGKHASYLKEELCQGGCGADRCVDMAALHQGRVINLGEAGHPMNGSVFVTSSAWPLLSKMTNTNFSSEPLARLALLPETDIAWFKPGRHPAQQVIAVSSSTGGAIAGSGWSTSTALSGAGSSTDVAISLAGNSTGNALGKSYRNTRHALGTSAQHVAKALHRSAKSDTPQ